jgi:SAM-dependent methyltransferase
MSAGTSTDKSANALLDITVNSRMNRGRGFKGVNSYERELRRFDITAFLRERAASGKPINWLDACCGEGRALGEALQLWDNAPEPWAACASVWGVDLWPHFAAPPAAGDRLRFVPADITAWLAEPDPSPFDLITCIHGLHYLPDKLAFLERAYERLAPEGILLTHLDTANLYFTGEGVTWSSLLRNARKIGVDVTHKNNLLQLRRTAAHLDFGSELQQVSASEKPNYTGMIVVDSWYKPCDVTPLKEGKTF